MYSRANRRTSFHKELTPQAVGPGSYENLSGKKLNPGFAGFGVSESRKLDTKENPSKAKTAPGKITGGDGVDTMSLYSRGEMNMDDGEDAASVEGGETTAGGLSIDYDSLRVANDMVNDTATIGTYGSNRSHLARYGEHGPLLTVATQQETVFMLDPEGMGSNLQLQNGNMTVVNTMNKKWNACRATTCFSTGVHHWEVVIDRCVSKNIFIGVMSAEGCLESYVGSDKYGWGYLANKAVWHNKGKIRSYGELFREGDRVGIHLDMDAGSLSFVRNGRDLGTAVEGLTGSLYPAFSMYNKDDQISLIPPVSSSSLSGGSNLAEQLIQNMALGMQLFELSDVCSPFSSAAAELSDRMSETSPSPFDTSNPTPAFTASYSSSNASSLSMHHQPSFLSLGFGSCSVDWHITPMQTSLVRIPSFEEFSLEMAEIVLKRLRQWEQGIMVRALTSQGTVLYVDSSRAACEPFGLYAFDRVLVSKGVARVLGASRHHLWYHLEGKQEAFCWHKRAVRDMLSRPSEYSIQRLSMDMEDLLPLPAVESGSLTASDISNIFKMWPPELDEELCSYMNAHGDFNQISPCNISYKALSTQPPAAAFPGLSERSLQEIRCRAAYLICLNDAMAPALPLVDFSLLSRQHCPASLISQRRNLLFGEIKTKLFERLIAHTASVTSDIKDDLISESPELVRLNVDLDEAASAASKTFPTVRGDFGTNWWDKSKAMEQTVFGQVAARVAQSSLKELRRSEAFEVSFLSVEGMLVPPPMITMAEMRQMLLWKVCREVREGAYPLFEPTNNCLLEFNTDRSQELSYCIGTRFCLIPVREPISLDSTRLAYYRTLGQIMGMAVRVGVPFPLQATSLLWKLMASQNLTREDLLEMDRDASGVALCFRYLTDLGLNVDNFEDLMSGVTFVAPTNSGEIVELFPGGRKCQVRLEDAETFANHLEQMRLYEAIPQIAAIYVGFTSVIPRHVLSLFTWKELEVLVCGRGGRRLMHVKRCSTYEEGLHQSDQHIQMFWEIMEEFSIETRTIFLELLNLDNANGPLRFVQPPAHIAERADEHFPLVDPTSHTFALPPYSNEDVMRRRIMRLLQTRNELSRSVIQGDIFEEYMNAYCS